MPSKRAFVSYRRDDQPEMTGRIRDRLVAALGRDAVYIDVDSVAPASDFRASLRDAIARCDIMLVVIGPRWADSENATSLQDPGDWVRLELEIALNDPDIEVLPVLIGNSTMPSVSELPDTLRDLAFRQAVRVRGDPDFHPDVDRILSGPPFATPRRWKSQTVFWTLGIAVCVAVVAVVGVVVLLRSRPTSTSTSDSNATPSSLTTTPVAVPAETIEAAAPGDAAGDDADAPIGSGLGGVASYGFVSVPPGGIQATADSSLAPQDRGRITYGPENVIDVDLDTAWAENADHLGTGTRIRLDLERPTTVDLVDVYAGWQTSFPCRYEKNGRPSVVLVEATTVDGEVVQSQSTGLQTDLGRSLLRTQLGHVSDGGVASLPAIVRIELEILDTQSGVMCDGEGPDDDLLISEIELSAWPGVCASGYDPDNSGWPQAVSPIREIPTSC